MNCEPSKCWLVYSAWKDHRMALFIPFFFLIRFLFRMKFMRIKNAYVHSVLKDISLCQFTSEDTNCCMYVLKLIDENILWSLDLEILWKLALSYISWNYSDLKKNEILFFSQGNAEKKKMNFFDDKNLKQRWNLSLIREVTISSDCDLSRLFL